MNQVNVLLGYDPRCTFYPKATPNGVVYYYLRYYLPGNIRVSRSVGQNKKEAKRLMFEKNQSLKEGVFDDFDFQRIPDGGLMRVILIGFVGYTYLKMVKRVNLLNDKIDFLKAKFDDLQKQISENKQKRKES